MRESGPATKFIGLVNEILSNATCITATPARIDDFTLNFTFPSLVASCIPSAVGLISSPTISPSVTTAVTVIPS
ncbi:MAG: hypothetical protein DDT22_00990 [candidate division WS2 bacterium]|nr:hypothetical protein [Candidatus Lithacetigena glycinireducens]